MLKSKCLPTPKFITLISLSKQNVAQSRVEVIP